MQVGCFVKIDGLQSEKARQHNGKSGVITSSKEKDTGRVGVKPHGMNRSLAIKPNNLTLVSLEDSLDSMTGILGSDKSDKDRQQYRKTLRVELLQQELMFKFQDEEFIYYGYDDNKWEIYGDKYVDFMQVDFLRPDGDIEGKDVQWCLDNEFYHIEEDLWAGNWYFRDNPVINKQLCVDNTQKIRNRNEKRGEYIKAKMDAESNAKQKQEDELNKILMRDLARYSGMSLDDPNLMVSPIGRKKPSKEHIAIQQRLAKTMK
jgi:hypothetical protein